MNKLTVVKEKHAWNNEQKLCPIQVVIQPPYLIKIANHKNVYVGMNK